MTSRPRKIGQGELASVLPSGGTALVSSCSAHSQVLHAMVEQAGNHLGDMQFTGVFVPGVNKAVWKAGEDSRVLTFFQTPELKAEADRSEFRPISYGQISAHFRNSPPEAVLFTCSPPNDDGYCSFGTECSFAADFWGQAATRIAHVNPSMPRPSGYQGIPWSEISGYVEQDSPILSVPSGEANQVARDIARQLEPFIGDGATLQTGLGKVPDAVLDQLHDRKGLRMHTGLVGDGAMHLAASGALAGRGSIVTGTAIGSEELYAAIEQDWFEFQPVSVTHDVVRMGQHASFVAINSALQVDLFGQAYAEVSPSGAMSGPGGASDFASGTRLSKNGLSVVALASSAKSGQISRIVGPGAGIGPVSLSRLSIDLVVTEYGVADFRNTTHEARVEQLIAIAAPQFRSDLAAGWSDVVRSL